MAVESRSKPDKGTAAAKRYAPTQREREAVKAFYDRSEAKPPSPWIDIKMRDGRGEISIDHEDPGTGTLLLMRAIGTTETTFLSGILNQLANAGSVGRDAEVDGTNFMLSVIKGIEPKDEIEAMLGAQMAAVHMATMTFARRLAHVENIAQQDSAEKAFNKLARTFASQVEALKRYRTGGEQKMTVEHVTVNDGGQAIVGNVAGRGDGRKHGG